MSKPFVAILMGSKNDLPVMQATVDVLKSLDINHEIRVSSAHRTPHDTVAYVEEAEARGCAVFVAAAGMAAHLAGVIAAHTVCPVIGVPVDAGPLQGLDALLSTVQMPGGIPVATVAIGKAGAKNAGFLSAQIIAKQDSQIADRLRQQRKTAAATIREQNETLAVS